MLGCAEPVDSPPANVPTGVEDVVETEEELPSREELFRTEPDEEIEAKLYDTAWITPAMVEIGNFFPGAQAEWNIRVHNGNDAQTVSESWNVGTEPDETEVPLTLGWPLAGSDIAGVSMTSDNPGDQLIPASYDAEAKVLTVSGFASDDSRTMTLTYDAWTEFTVYFRFPNRVKDGFAHPTEEVEDWVIIADMTPVLAPKETREIGVVVAMPDDAVAPADHWEFWIAVLEEGQGTVQTEMCSRWLVSMR